MLLFQHIPKTAGTAFRLYILDNIGSAFAAYYGREPETHPALRTLDINDEDAVRTAIASNGIRLIQAHDIRPFFNIFPDVPVLCCLREPKQRALSNYFHILRGGGTDAEMSNRLRSGELDLVGYVRANNHVYSDILRWIDGAGHPIALCFHERLNEAVTLLNERLGWKGRLQQRNLSSGQEHFRAAQLIAENGAELSAALAEDTALYETALRTWDEGPGKTAFLDLMANAPPRYSGLDGPRLRYRLKQLQLKIRPDTPRNTSGKAW